jgi:ribA/ribD-fused uncharacterized protein
MVSESQAAQPSAIRSFSGKYRFLSNFYPALGSTVEHHFQAAKAVKAEASAWVMAAPNPGIAKKRGRQVKLRADWNAVRNDVMLGLLRRKFEDPELRHLLMSTGDAELIEGNTWGDTYWGVCNGVGENWLGKLLMQVREEIANAN